ncbi:MAG: ABC transporter ATP-binding protein [Clostridia bacterium]|nr:ABC transporter ATP-binding protein [Clostridia bacterium]
MNITADNVFKSFGEKAVLKDFSVQISEGETVCLFGESGAGKTTFVRLLMGLEKPDSGKITGVPNRISAVFQEDRLCETFTALRNLKLAANVDDKTALAALEELGISREEACGKPVSAFSGGMRRRVVIARALLFEPELLILDEPFKGLDKENLRKAVEFIRARSEKMTVVMVSHSAEEMELMGGRKLEITAI